jgi:hypothetical protein
MGEKILSFEQSLDRIANRSECVGHWSVPFEGISQNSLERASFDLPKDCVAVN